MANALQIVVCAGIVPDPLQTLEPVTGPNGPGLKNEMVLPAVLDPWAACALYEAAQLAAKNPGSKLWLVSLGPKAKLQQVMMTVGQKAAFELVPSTAPSAAFPTRTRRRPRWPRPSPRCLGSTCDASALRRMGVCHARRGRHAAACRRAAGHHRPVSGRRPDQAARRRIVRGAGARGGRQAPGLGLRGHARRSGLGDGQSCRAAQQSADRHGEYARHHAGAAEGEAVELAANGLRYVSVGLPKQQRETRVEKNMTPDEIARELVDWIGAE